MRFSVITLFYLSLASLSFGSDDFHDQWNKMAKPLGLEYMKQTIKVHHRWRECKFTNAHYERYYTIAVLEKLADSFLPSSGEDYVKHLEAFKAFYRGTSSAFTVNEVIKQYQAQKSLTKFTNSKPTVSSYEDFNQQKILFIKSKGIPDLIETTEAWLHNPACTGALRIEALEVLETYLPQLLKTSAFERYIRTLEELIDLQPENDNSVRLEKVTSYYESDSTQGVNHEKSALYRGKLVNTKEFLSLPSLNQKLHIIKLSFNYLTLGNAFLRTFEFDLATEQFTNVISHLLKWRKADIDKDSLVSFLLSSAYSYIENHQEATLYTIKFINSYEGDGRNFEGWGFDTYLTKSHPLVRTILTSNLVNSIITGDIKSMETITNWMEKNFQLSLTPMPQQNQTP